MELHVGEGRLINQCLLVFVRIFEVEEEESRGVRGATRGNIDGPHGEVEDPAHGGQFSARGVFFSELLVEGEAEPGFVVGWWRKCRGRRDRFLCQFS